MCQTWWEIFHCLPKFLIRSIGWVSISKLNSSRTRSGAWGHDHLHSSVVERVPSPFPRLGSAMGMSQEWIPTSSLGVNTLFWGLKGFQRVSVGCPRLQCQRTILGRFHLPLSFQRQTPTLDECVIRINPCRQVGPILPSAGREGAGCFLPSRKGCSKRCLVALAKAELWLTSCLIRAFSSGRRHDVC